MKPYGMFNTISQFLARCSYETSKMLDVTLV